MIGRDASVFNSARSEKSFELCAYELFTIVRNEFFGKTKPGKYLCQYPNDIAWGDFSQHMRFQVWKVVLDEGQIKFPANWTNYVSCAFNPRTTG